MKMGIALTTEMKEGAWNCGNGRRGPSKRHLPSFY
jgi:hypothetical protein